MCVSNENDDDVCIYEQFISWAELVKRRHYLNGKGSSFSHSMGKNASFQMGFGPKTLNFTYSKTTWNKQHSDS